MCSNRFLAAFGVGRLASGDSVAANDLSPGFSDAKNERSSTGVAQWLAAGLEVYLGGIFLYQTSFKPSDF